MVFGLFKKKKAQKAEAAQAKGQHPQPVEPVPHDEEVATKPHKEKKGKSPAVDASEDQWMYESVTQFLRSPLWKIPILSFFDENCIIFDQDEDNNPEHLEAHEAYQKLVHGLMNDLMNELEISEDKLMGIVQIGLKTPEDKKYFEQLVTVENFTVFKNQMIKRNKQLEHEALQQLHEIEKQKNQHQEQHYAREQEGSRSLQQLELEKEQAEIDAALALSLAVEKEKQAMEEQEDFEMQEALRQSQVEYNTFQEGQREKERELEREIERAKQKQRELEEIELAKSQEIARSQALAQKQEQAAIQHNEEEKTDPYKQVKTKKLEPLSNAPKVSQSYVDGENRGSVFPPINNKFEPMSLNELLQEKDRVGSKIQQIKQEEPATTESLEERKKRLKAQRDLILAKKKAERDAELKLYETKRESEPAFVKENISGRKLSNEEMERRKEIYNKLKGEL